MTANRQIGWRIERAPDKPLGRTNAGRFFIPLRITTDGQDVGEAHLVLTGSDSEQLVGELSRLIHGGVEPAALDPIGGPA
ncbi:hypothetical protein JHN63_20280 [Streptomyces sp. MBT65]|uniref:hypothetical protein n=1 Tax=Streptomyces sp. MBT65 TaxID=1488395 RepID=UPI00190AA944|nr:hypothetical protein [Streptomyces sp. MBT65]MBK3576113.1 hypothetical protein [Streptomyces sp. MBT65]